MSFIGNILWFLTCGLWQGLSWLAAGVLWCITIVGIPVGMQCFKFAELVFWPFGKTVVHRGGTVSFLLNVIWFFVSGLPLALAAAVNGLLLCVTIIGIPFGMQCFKFAGLALHPFGAEVVRSYY